MKLTSKQILIIVAVVLVILVIVGIWFYRKGKKQTTIAPYVNDTPGATGSGSTTGTGTNNPAGVSVSQISMISQALFNEMDGFNVWRDTKPFTDLMILSDTDFVKVYNKFNTDYQAEGDGTLKQWIEDESGVGEFATIREAILQRMARLNLI
jgi:hypothetical protein